MGDNPINTDKYMVFTKGKLHYNSLVKSVDYWEQGLRWKRKKKRTDTHVFFKN